MLEEELSRFFSWCGLRRQEYLCGYHPFLKYPISAEWEDEYPFWESLQVSYHLALSTITSESHDLIAEIVTAISIDWTSGRLFQSALEIEDADFRKILFQTILASGSFNAKEMLFYIEDTDSCRILQDVFEDFVIFEKSNHIVKLAIVHAEKNSLRHLLRICERTAMHPDNEIRLYSLDMLRKYDNQRFALVSEYLSPGFILEFNRRSL